MVDNFSVESNKIDKTPAAEHVFVVDLNCPKLDENQKLEFHMVTVKGIFVGKRARPDVQMVVAFLSARVKEPDQDD